MSYVTVRPSKWGWSAYENDDIDALIASCDLRHRDDMVRWLENDLDAQVEIIEE